MTPEILNYLSTYIRMISYTIVILCSAFFMFNIRQYKWIIIGNMFAATFFLTSAFFSGLIGMESTMVRNTIILPGAVIWAVIHFYVFIKK